jgi:hypothetical protein
MLGRYTIGLSHLDEKDSNTNFRREEAVDLWFRPASKMELQGLSAYNSIGRGWMQHSYYLTIGPFGAVRINGEFSRVDYRQYFTSTTTSAFTFPNIEPDETVTAGGGSIEYALTPSLTAVADYRTFKYRIAGHAGYYGGKVSYAGGDFGAGAGLHRMDGATDQLNYNELAVFVSRKMSRADVSLQYLHLAYKQKINDVKYADNGTAAAGYALTPKARVVADMEYARTPDFNHDVRAMATFTYQFEVKLAKQTPEKTTAGPKIK